MGIVDEGISRELDVVNTAIVETGSIVDSLDVGGIPIIGAVDKSIVEHIGFITEEVESEGKAVCRVIQGDKRFFGLVAICIKQHRFHIILVVEVMARKVESLWISAQGHAKEKDKEEDFFHRFFGFTS